MSIRLPVAMALFAMAMCSITFGLLTSAEAMPAGPVVTSQMTDSIAKASAAYTEVRHVRRIYRRHGRHHGRYYGRRHGGHYGRHWDNRRHWGHGGHWGHSGPYWPYYGGWGYGGYYGWDNEYETPYYNYGGSHVRWCLNRYRSYDPASDTYMGYDGRRHYCRSPYR